MLVVGTVVLATAWTVPGSTAQAMRKKIGAGSWKMQQLLLSPWLGPDHLGDGGVASKLLLCDPMGLAMDSAGTLFVSDRGRGWRGRVVWRIDDDGVARIVAGTGRQGDARKEWARETSFGKPEGLAVDRRGRLFMADAVRHAVYRIDPDGRIVRVAGTGDRGASGDGGPANAAKLNRPSDVRLDSHDNLYIADVLNHRVRMVDANGRIRTVAGTGTPGFSPDGTPADQAMLDTPWGIGIDGEDRLLIADSENHRVRRREHDGTLTTLAGSGERGFSGDGGPATHARLDTPNAVYAVASGRVFIGDEHNHALRVVLGDGTIRTVAGTGASGVAPIGSIAAAAPLGDPESVIVRRDGTIVVSEGRNGRVIEIDSAGRVGLVAGRAEVSRCTARW